MKRTLEARTRATLQVLNRRIERVRVLEAQHGDGGQSKVLSDCRNLLEEWLNNAAAQPQEPTT